MRAYADSSFILRLLLSEADSPHVIAAFRKAGRPALFFLPLHGLEVQCGIRQRAFFRRRSAAVSNTVVAHERDAAISKLNAFLARQLFREVSVESDAVFKRAAKLATQYAEQIGARSIDLLHVAGAIELKTELFLTTDNRQSQIATSEGLKVLFVK